MRASHKTLLLFAMIVIIAGYSWFAWSVSEAGKKSAHEMTGGDPDKGKATIYNLGCGACHTIPGIPGAYAAIGPPLTQMGNRNYIAGVIKNTPDNLTAWIQNPPAIDSKTAMPHLRVSESDARDIAAYIYTLR